MKKKHKEQGDLDALCGIYAIVNAFTHLGVDKRYSKRLFKLACKGLPAKKWPKVLWNGTYLKDIKRMIKNCQKRSEPSGTLRIDVSYPFKKETPENDEEFWHGFDILFEDKSEEKCAIIGLTQPYDHWIVVAKESPGRLRIIDSLSSDPPLLKNRSSFTARDRSPDHRKWKIIRKDLVLFKLKA